MLGAILGGAQLLGSIFGGAGRGAAESRQAENDFLQRENMLRSNQYSTQQQALLSLLGLDENATMNRAQLGLQAPNVRAKQAVLGSLLSRLQPAQIQAPAGIRVGQISGGLGDAIGGAGMRGAGNLLQLQALKALASKSDVPAAANYASRGMLAPPQMNAYKKPGKGESLLSMLGLAGGVLGAIGGARGSGDSAPSMSNAMPTPYVGRDQYGNKIGWQLPRGEVMPALMAQQNMNVVPFRG